MLSDIKQVELDLVEEKVLTAVFGSTTPNAKAQWVLNFLGINLQKIVDDFEFFVLRVACELLYWGFLDDDQSGEERGRSGSAEGDIGCEPCDRFDRASAGVPVCVAGAI